MKFLQRNWVLVVFFVAGYFAFKKFSAPATIAPADSTLDSLVNGDTPASSPATPPAARPGNRATTTTTDRA